MTSTNIHYRRFLTISNSGEIESNGESPLRMVKILGEQFCSYQPIKIDLVDRQVMEILVHDNLS